MILQNNNNTKNNTQSQLFSFKNFFWLSALEAYLNGKLQWMRL